MIADVLSVVAMAGLALLIVAKSDQESTIILKGKILKKGIDTKIADKIYRKNTSLTSVIYWVIGFLLLSISVIMFSRQNLWSILFAAIGLILAGIGVCGRIQSFQAAARELDDLGLQ